MEGLEGRKGKGKMIQLYFNLRDKLDTCFKKHEKSLEMLSNYSYRPHPARKHRGCWQTQGSSSQTHFTWDGTASGGFASKPGSVWREQVLLLGVVMTTLRPHAELRTPKAANSAALSLKREFSRIESIFSEGT